MKFLNRFEITLILIILSLGITIIHLYKELKIVLRVNMELNTELGEEKTRSNVYYREFMICNEPHVLESIRE